MPEVRLDVYADTHGAPGELKKTEDALAGVERVGGSAHVSLGGLWKQFALGQIAADALRQGFSLLKDFVGGSITAGLEAEKAQRSLELALGTTGRTVNAMLPGLKDHAGEIQKMTVYDDEAVMSVQALLAQLTSLDSQGLRRATEGAVGLASVFKMDLESAGNLVAKAMAGNMAALSRYGIKVAENIPLEEKRNQLMQQLSTFYERAKGETDTFSGSLSQLKNMWGEVQEKVGGAIIQNESVKNGIKDLKDWVTKLAESEDFKLWLDGVISGLIKAVELVGKFAGGVKDLTEKVFGAKGANKEFEESQIKLNEALKRAHEHGVLLRKEASNFVGPLQQVKTEVNETGNALRNMGDNTEKTKVTLANTSTPLGNLRTRFVELERTLVNGVIPAARTYLNIIPELAATPEHIDATNEFFNNLPSTAKKATDTTKGYFDGLYNDIARGMGDTMGDFVGEIAKGLDFTHGEFFKGGIKFKKLFEGLFGDIKDAFFRMIGEMVADKVLDAFKGFFSSAAKAGGDAMAGAAKTAVGAAGDIVKGASGAISGLWTGLGAAVGTFLGTLLGGGKKDNSDVTYWLKMIKDNSQILVNMITDNFNGMIHELVDGKNRLVDQNDWQIGQLDSMIGWLASIEGNTRPLLDMKSAASGIDMVTSRAGLLMYHPNERVIVKEKSETIREVAPAGRTVPEEIHIYLDGREISASVKRRGQIGDFWLPSKSVR